MLPALLSLALAGCITPIPAPSTATPTTSPAGAAQTSIPYEVLANATYQGVYEQPVTLVDGSYEGEPFVEGGASRPTLTLLPEPIGSGDLNGDDLADAAVLLAENSGGSGTFIYLAAMLNTDSGTENVATTLLGDRIQVQGLSIESGRITVDAMTFADSDPQCCPSQPVTRTFELQGDMLVEVSS
jgi:hypothetical protein